MKSSEPFPLENCWLLVTFVAKKEKQKIAMDISGTKGKKLISQSESKNSIEEQVQ
jgi:hypothetical protein